MSSKLRSSESYFLSILPEMKYTHHKNLLVLFFLSLPLILGAQDYFLPSLRVGVTPSAFLNYYRAAQVSVDKRLIPRANAELELGYIYTSIFDSQGFRIRPGVEWLLGNGDIAGVTLGLHYNFRWTAERRTLERRDRSGEFTRIFYNQKRVRTYHGPMISLKTMFRLGSRWTLDIGAGGGLAGYNIREEMEAELGDRFLNDVSVSAIDQTQGLWIITIFHVNVSYVIQR